MEKITFQKEQLDEMTKTGRKNVNTYLQDPSQDLVDVFGKTFEEMDDECSIKKWLKVDSVIKLDRAQLYLYINRTSTINT